MKITDWLRADKKPESIEEQTPDHEESPREIHRSPILKLLSKKLEEDRKFHILDIGPPLNENVVFLSQFRCKVHIDDFYSSYRGFDFFAPADEGSLDKLFSYLLPLPAEARFDIIFLWDIMNYMKLEECGYLFKHLEKYSRPGTAAFAMIYTRREMPEVPTSFRITSNERIHYDFNSSITKSCPRHEGPPLEERLGRFGITNSYLLRNGFKEYLLTCS